MLPSEIADGASLAWGQRKLADDLSTEQLRRMVALVSDSVADKTCPFKMLDLGLREATEWMAPP